MNVEAVLTSYSAFDAALGKYYGAPAFVGTAIDSFQKADGKEPSRLRSTSSSFKFTTSKRRAALSRTLPSSRS